MTSARWTKHPPALLDLTLICDFSDARTGMNWYGPIVFSNRCLGVRSWILVHYSWQLCTTLPNYQSILAADDDVEHESRRKVLGA